MKEEKTKTEAVVTTQGKKTRGKVDAINRVAWFYMRKQLKLEDVKIAPLKGATCPAKVNDRAATLVRIFDPAAAKEKGVTIEDYENLNEQPELILYEGYYMRGRGGETIIERREGVGTSLLEEKIKKGAITDVGVISEKATKRKGLSIFVHFLMMGGWILILIVGLGIAIAISILTSGS